MKHLLSRNLKRAILYLNTVTMSFGASWNATYKVIKYMCKLDRLSVLKSFDS